MDRLFELFLTIFAGAVGGSLCIGLTALFRIRSQRQERQQMKRHLQTIDRPGWYEYPRGMDACDRPGRL